MKIFIIILIAFALIGAGAVYYVYQSRPLQTTASPHGQANTSTAPVLLNTVKYVCNQEKSIDAAFYRKQNVPVAKEGEQPIPDGTVELKLSDGRAFRLDQTISADGTRYANEGESFIFWAKGNGALILENNQEKTFIGCVVASSVVEGASLPAVYANKDGMFSLRLPSLAKGTSDGFKVDDTFEHSVTPEKNIAGVQFTIPKALSEGTNLSSDSYLSVESIAHTQECSAGLFLDGGSKASEVIDSELTYSFASTSDAGAGNRYEEMIYALPNTNPCLAVHYFIHYGVFENYPTGSITEFNRSALLHTFDQIRRTLVINQ